MLYMFLFQRNLTEYYNAVDTENMMIIFARLVLMYLIAVYILFCRGVNPNNFKSNKLYFNQPCIFYYKITLVWFWFRLNGRFRNGCLNNYLICITRMFFWHMYIQCSYITSCTSWSGASLSVLGITMTHLYINCIIIVDFKIPHVTRWY